MQLEDKVAVITDRWLSNMHRVANPPAGAAPSGPRLSIAFFNHPNYDALIECLPSQGAAKHPPVLSGDYRDLKYSQTGLAGAAAAAGEGASPSGAR